MALDPRLASVDLLAMAAMRAKKHPGDAPDRKTVTRLSTSGVCGERWAGGAACDLPDESCVGEAGTGYARIVSRPGTRPEVATC